jgi:hypothetical protein
MIVSSSLFCAIFNPLVVYHVPILHSFELGCKRKLG